MSPWNSKSDHQPAGLSTAECPSFDSSARPPVSPEMNKTCGAEELSSPNRCDSLDSDVRTLPSKPSQRPQSPQQSYPPQSQAQPPPQNPTPTSTQNGTSTPPPTPPLPPRRSSKFGRLNSLPLFRPSPPSAEKPRRQTTQGISLQSQLQESQRSISESAPTVMITTTSTHALNAIPLKSAMCTRTIHESLHRGYSSRGRYSMSDSIKNGDNRHPYKRSVSFANVNIREYERVVGDNPSVTSGVPLSIGWRYCAEPIQMKIDDYEEGKGVPRSSSEYLVPKVVREQLLKEHADASRNEIAKAVRGVNIAKSQRRKTVVNLGMMKTEEKVEKAKRSVKKILGARKNYDAEEEKLWEKAHVVAMEKAKRLEDSLRNGEMVSRRNVYAVGTPCNNLVPSMRAVEWENEKIEMTDSDALDENVVSKETDENADEKVGDPRSRFQSVFEENDLDVSSARRSSFHGPYNITKQENETSHFADRKYKRRSESDLSAAEDLPPLDATPLHPNIVATENDDVSEEIFAQLMLDNSETSS